MPGSKRSTDESFREDAYLRTGTMTGNKRHLLDDEILNRDSLALGAVGRVNIVHHILGDPELTLDEAAEMGSQDNQYIFKFWQDSVHHGYFWTSDQFHGRPNFIE